MKLDMKLKLVLLAAIMICSCEMPDADEGVPEGGTGRDLIVELSFNGIGATGSASGTAARSVSSAASTEIRRTVVPANVDTSALSGSIKYFKINITGLSEIIIDCPIGEINFTLENILLRSGYTFVIRAYDMTDTLLASARKILSSSDVDIVSSLPYRIALSLLPVANNMETLSGNISLALTFPSGIATALSAQLIRTVGSVDTTITGGSVATNFTADPSTATVTYDSIPVGTYTLVLTFTKPSYTSSGTATQARVGVFVEGVNVWDGYTSNSWLDNNSSPLPAGESLPTVRTYTADDFAGTDTHVALTLARPDDAAQTIGLTQFSYTDSSSVWNMSYTDVCTQCADGNLRLGIELLTRGQCFTGYVYKTSNGTFSLLPASMTSDGNMHFETVFGSGAGAAGDIHFTPATYISLTVYAEDGVSSRNYTIRFDVTEREFFTGASGAEGNSGFSDAYPLPLNTGVNALTSILTNVPSSSNLTMAKVIFVNDITAGQDGVVSDGEAVLSFTSVHPKIVLSGASSDTTFSGSGLNTVLYVGRAADVTLGNNLVITGGGGRAYGGGVHVASQGTFKMTGGKIESNTALSRGGGVYIEYLGTFTMSGGEIKNNSAISAGGGVYIEGEYIDTYTYGGIIYTDRYRGGTFNMSGGKISANYSSGSGGGIYVGGGSSTTYGATFTKTAGTVTGGGAADKNNAAGAGKTLYVESGATSPSTTTDTAF
jgi:hypothetical protein